MAFTPLLGLSLPVTGTLSGTWGDEINNSITSLVDSAVAGTTTLSTDADVTLTTTSGVANTAREAILLCSGARTAVRYITAPAQSKTYTVINATTGGYNVYIRGAGPTAGIAVPMGYSVKVAWNGSDFVQMSVPISNVSGLGTGVATALAISVGTAGSPVVNGGALGTPSSGTVTNLTGTANITATGGASGAIAATTLSASSTVSGTGFSTYLASPPAIGGTAPAAVSATSLTDSGNLTFTGTGNRITGNMTSAISGGTPLALQTSTANSITQLYIIPNGTSKSSFLLLGSGTSADENFLQIGLNNAGSQAGINSGITGTGTYLPITFSTGGSERVRVDTSGNVGIGVIPGTKLQALGIIKSGGTGTNGEFNLARTSDGLSVGKITLTESTQILDYNNLLGSGVHTFTINAVERMRIDANGNVGIGTPSPSQRLTISDTGAGLNRDLAVRNGDATNFHQLAVGYNAGALSSGVPANSLFMLAEPGGGYGAVGGLSMGTIGAAPIISITNGAERMRIDSSGNVGIGTSSPGAKFEVYGASNPELRVNDGTVNFQIYSGTGASAAVMGTIGSHALAFRTNSTERMRIAADGSVIIGDTTARGQLTVSQNASTGTSSYLVNLNTASNVTKSSSLYFAGYDTASTYKPAAYITCVPNDVNYVGSYLSFGTRASDTVTEQMRITSDGRIYGTALHNNAGSVTGTTTQYIASGTYTPTLTNVATISSSTAYLCQWIRVGNVVTVSGRVDITASVAGFIFTLGVSFPIASTITATTNCAGTFGAGSAATTGSPCILGDTTNVRASFSAAAASTSSTSYYFSFTYLVL